MTDRELMQQALTALESLFSGQADPERGQRCSDAITALRERLAQPEQEPVAWADMDVRGEDKGLSWTPGHFHKTPIYTAPPQRKPLTDEEIDKLPWGPHEGNPVTFAEGLRDFARAIEAAHGIKGDT